MKNVVNLLIVSALCSHCMGQSNEPTPYNPPPPTSQPDSPGSDDEAMSEQCIYKHLTNIPQNYNTSFEENRLDGWMNKYMPGRYYYNNPIYYYYSNFYPPIYQYYQRRWRRSLGSNYYNIPFHYQTQGSSFLYPRPLSVNNLYSPTLKGWKKNTGGTPTSGTGPSSADDGKFYLYMEANDYRPGDFVTLYTKRELRGCFCMYFSYHLNVNNFGKQASNHTLTVKTQDKVLMTYTTPGNKWKLTSLNFDTKFPTMIRIIATRGSNNHGDIAIDDIKIKPGKCNYQPCSYCVWPPG